MPDIPGYQALRAGAVAKCTATWEGAGAGVLASTGRYYLIPETTQSIQVQPLPDRALALVQVKNGSLVTDSLMVAEVFEKEHKDVLRAIENLECSQQFRERNFTPSNYLSSQGKNLSCVEMTRDGFTFLAMRFTGSKAAAGGNCGAVKLISSTHGQ